MQEQHIRDTNFLQVCLCMSENDCESAKSIDLGYKNINFSEYKTSQIQNLQIRKIDCNEYNLKYLMPFPPNLNLFYLKFIVFGGFIKC